MNKPELWIKLALSDLKGARLLYAEKQYRTSYFLFQQASEKANKAFFLKFELAKAEDLRKASHNQIKIFKNYIVAKISEYNKLSAQSKEDPTKFPVKVQGLSNSLKGIDRLAKKNLINLPLKELQKLYDEIQNFKLPFLKRNPKAKEYLQKSKQAKNINIMVMLLLQHSLDFFYIMMSLFICAILTNQHSSISRYPDQGKNPLNIYTSKLSLVKMQIQYMNLLEDAIKKMIKHSDKRLIERLGKLKLVNADT